MREFEAISNESQVGPKVASVSERSELDEVLRDGARRMLLQAVETEAAAYIDAHHDEIDELFAGGAWWCATDRPTNEPSSAVSAR